MINNNKLNCHVHALFFTLMYLPQMGTMASPYYLSPSFQNSKVNSGRVLEITLLGMYTCECLGMLLAVLVANLDRV